MPEEMKAMQATGLQRSTPPDYWFWQQTNIMLTVWPEPRNMAWH
jgi:hypothetical protein